MILVCDTETTSLDPLTGGVVEFAAVVLEQRNGAAAWKIGKTFSSLVKPPCPIGIEAMAIHHITEADVLGAPGLAEVLGELPKAKANHYCGHNAAFDSGFLPGLSPWLCTWRLAQHVWPEAPGHSNQLLRYWLPGLNAELRSTKRGAAVMAWSPHRAPVDAWVTAHIMLRLLAARPLAELAALSAAPILLRTVRFGMHRGVPWGDVPEKYLRWILDQDFDGDVRHTARHWLAARIGALKKVV